MKTSIQLDLPEDFSTLCTIYQIKPETFVQSFINQVSFPCFYSNPTSNDRWATYFFLNFLDAEEEHTEVNRELEEHYLNLFNKNLMQLLAQKENGADAEEAGRKVMEQWLKAILAERAKYITDYL